MILYRQKLFVFFVDQNTVVPVVVNPVLKPFFERLKVHDPSEFIEFAGLDRHFQPVIMAVQIGTFSLMAEDSMGATKRNFTRTNHATTIVKRSELGLNSCHIRT